MMFSLKHLIIMAICVGVVCGLLFLIRKWDLHKASKMLLVVGIISELVKVFTYIILNEDEYGGILPKTDLPFQLCSIQILFVMVVVFTKNEKIKRVLLSFMMPSALIGAALAIAIPTPSSLNYWVITFQYFIYHSVLIVYAIKILLDKTLKLNVKDYVTCLVFLLVLMFFSIYINSMMYDGYAEVNFMYVVSPPVDDLPFLNENNGWFVYILHYAVVVMVSVTACYIKPIVLWLKNKFSKAEIKE